MMLYSDRIDPDDPNNAGTKYSQQRRRHRVSETTQSGTADFIGARNKLKKQDVSHALCGVSGYHRICGKKTDEQISAEIETAV